MNATRLRLSIALAHAVPGAALHLHSREAGALVASQHPAADLTIDEMRSTALASIDPRAPQLDELLADAEVGGSLLPLGAGLYLHDDDGRTGLWCAVPLSPTEIQAGLTAVECPPAPACIEVMLRPDHELGATAIQVSSVLDVDEDALVDVALHILGACLAAELDLAGRDRSRR
jgi:hypothetical protein